MPSVVATTSGAPAGTGSFATTLPAHTAGDLLVLYVAGKNNTAGAPTINNGWASTPLHTGGTGTTAADTGTVFMTVFYKVATSGSETAPTVTAGSPAPSSWGWMCRSYTPTAGRTMAAPNVAFASDAVTGTTGLTGTTGSWSGAVDASNAVVQAVGITTTDSGTANANAEDTITVPGFSGGTLTAASTDYVETTLGGDCALLWAHLTGATGTSSGAPTVFFGVTGGNNDSGGVMAVAVYDTAGSSPATATGSGAWSFAGAGVGDTPLAGPPTLTRRIAGTTGLIRTVTTDTTSARLKIGTDSAVTTGVVYTAPVAVDGTWHAVHDTTALGLTPGGTYYFRVEMTGLSTIEDSGSVGRFRVAPASATSFAFDFGSCADYTLMPGGQTDSLALAAIAARSDDLFIHLGDLWYADGTGTDVANFRARMGSSLDMPATSTILSTRASTYTPSDHDAGMANDTNSVDDAAGLASFNQVHREEWPQPHPASGVYYAFTWGRVRFIQLDSRTFRSRQSVTDNASKTMLGATQKQWLKDQITNATEPLIFIVQDVPWIGAASAGSDTWTGYTTERTELAAHINSAAKDVVIIAGDMHSAAFDDGTNSPGGIPVLHGSPFLTNASRDPGPYTSGPIPSAGTAVSQQYGRVVITDNGGLLTAVFTAYDGANTQLVTGTMVYGDPAGSGAGSWDFAGTGAGRRSPVATGAGSWGFAGAGTGRRPAQAVGAGAWAFAGAGVGQTAAVDGGEATGAGAWGFVGAGVGRRSALAVGAGSWTFVGATNAPPAAHVGRILNARLSAPQATGRTSTPQATGDIT